MDSKVVPVEPTHEMFIAGGRALASINSQYPHGSWSSHADAVYRAMLSAAPPVEGGEALLDWSKVRSILMQGAAIQQDYAAGKFIDYEEYAARMDAAARERIEELKGRT